MDGFINALVGDFGPTITLIVVIAIAVIGILRLGVKFDLNQFLTARKKRHLALARHYCPHIHLTPRGDNNVQIQSLFYTPYGTLDWICSQCGLVVHMAPSDEGVQESARYFLENPEEYTKRVKRFHKHMRKAM